LRAITDINITTNIITSTETLTMLVHQMLVKETIKPKKTKQRLNQLFQLAMVKMEHQVSIA
jgi:hypothetical protein